MAESKEQREAREAEDARTRERQSASNQSTREAGTVANPESPGEGTAEEMQEPVEPMLSPEGVPYQSSGFEGTWRDKENPGPVPPGEGHNTVLEVEPEMVDKFTGKSQETLDKERQARDEAKSKDESARQAGRADKDTTAKDRSSGSTTTK